jgi:hypothetical protein
MFIATLLKGRPQATRAVVYYKTVTKMKLRNFCGLLRTCFNNQNMHERKVLHSYGMKLSFPAVNSVPRRGGPLLLEYSTISTECRVEPGLWNLFQLTVPPNKPGNPLALVMGQNTARSS